MFCDTKWNATCLEQNSAVRSARETNFYYEKHQVSRYQFSHLIITLCKAHTWRAGLKAAFKIFSTLFGVTTCDKFFLFFSAGV